MFDKNTHGIKICSNQILFISLERFWNINIKNDFACLIWRCKFKIMTKKKVENQIFKSQGERD